MAWGKRMGVEDTKKAKMKEETRKCVYGRFSNPPKPSLGS